MEQEKDMLGIFRRLAARRIRHRLHHLDDRMLKDIGLSRSEIDRIAAGHPACSGAANVIGSVWRASRKG